MRMRKYLLADHVCARDAQVSLLRATSFVALCVRGSLEISHVDVDEGAHTSAALHLCRYGLKSLLSCSSEPRPLSLPARAAFRFANYYGDHMVLQRAPAQANVWGYVDGCAPVNVTFNSSTISATVTPGNVMERS